MDSCSWFPWGNFTVSYIGGIALALVATIFFNYAPLLMKVGLGQMKEISSSNLWASIKGMFQNRKWLAGFGLGIVGGIVYFVALEIAGVTIVQPLLNFGFIVLAIMAHRLLGETLDLKAKFAIVILIAMPFFIALSQVTPPNLYPNYRNMVWFSVVLLIILGVLYLISRKIVILWAITTGILLGMTAVFTQWFTNIFFQVLSSTGNIFLAVWDGIIALLFLGAVTIVGTFVFNQIGLQKNPASRFNPINGTTNVTLGILGGIIVFGQTVTCWGFYITGFVMGIIGIMLLTRYQVDTSTKTPAQIAESTPVINETTIDVTNQENAEPSDDHEPDDSTS
ncbi:MAG TPA: hypothetical protein VKK79_14580 [Candidatus Lokiarchaeia archaeon]|nr:hypothetical protein [Candidatus Lokiarchaeia archaeon]